MTTEGIDVNKKMFVVSTVYILFFMRNTGKYILRKHVAEYNGGLSGAAARTGNFKKIIVINGKKIGIGGSYKNDHKTIGA